MKTAQRQEVHKATEKSRKPPPINFSQLQCVKMTFLFENE
jgi:hypothetical protein